MKKVLLLIMVIALCFTFTACKAEVNVYLDESDEAFTDDNSSVDDTEDITDTESATSSDDEGMQAPTENNNASGDKGEGKKPSGSTEDKKPASSGGQSGTTPTPTPMPSTPVAKEYTVTFNSNGGSAVASAKTSGKVTKPADPTHAGYKFLGWYKQGSSTAWNFDDKVTADITLVATWEAIEYNVTFDSNGGSAVSAAKTVGGKVTKPADPTRSGYKFMGWYKQGSSTAWNFGDKVTADITLVATWEAIEYNVTFDSAGGSAVAAAKTSGQKAVEPISDPTRAGYIFAGWYKQGSSTAWNFDDKVTADITLVAKWEIVEYTVTFVFDNGENDNESYSTVNHKVVTKPADPEKKNCKFTGWYNQSTGKKWDFDDETFADLVLVADWTIAGDHSPIIPFD